MMVSFNRINWQKRTLDVFIAALCVTSASALKPPPNYGISNDAPFPNEAGSLFDANRRVEGTSEETGEGCDICAGLHGTGILPDDDTPIPTFPTGALTSDPPNEGTCSDWNNSLAENVPPGSFDCIYHAYYLAPQCCDRSNMTASYVCETQLKSNFFGDDSDYETTVVPVPAGKDHLDVDVNLVFWHISSIDTVEGTAELFFGITLYWKDERLAWDPAEHDGCLDMHVRASLDPETTEVYVPDFNLLNRVSGVQSLPAEMAQVAADGTVIWGRNGGLKAICAYTGLEPIPFDALGCYFQFGSDRARKTMYHFRGGNPGTPGLVIGNFSSKYQEFSLMQDKSETYIDYISEYRTLNYQFYFDRANHYYITKIVIPTILFTFLSFGTFMLDQRVGERLGFGVSILLVMVAQSIVTADMLPISKQSLWIDAFALWSYYWVIVAVFESVVVAYLYYLDSEEEERKAEVERSRREQEEQEEKARQAHEAHIRKMEEKKIMKARRRETERNNNMTFNAVESECAVEVFQDEMRIAPSDVSDAFSESTHEFNPETPSTPERKWNRADSTRNPSSLFAVFTGKESGTMRWRLRVIQKLDRVSLIVLPTTYLLYIIIMLATAKYWG